MKNTNYKLTTEQTLKVIPFVNQIGLNNLSNSGVIKRKKRLGVWRYDTYSLTSFVNSINTNDYISTTETKIMLEKNGIKDFFKRFSNKSDVLQCRYIRVTNEFPMSVRNLIKYGYLDVLKNVSPLMIRKKSVQKTIKHFKGLKKTMSIPKTTVSKVSNNTDYNSILLSLFKKVS